MVESRSLKSESRRLKPEVRASSYPPSVLIISWRTIIRSFPFPLYFDPSLWRWMTETVIAPRQRVLTSLRQHSKKHGGLFVGWGVADFVRVAAGEAIYGTFGGIHGHV
jgi:hypothetical protein